MKHGLLAVVVGLATLSLVRADDWPQFRGPDRTGVSKEKGLLKAWPKEGPKLAWKFKDAGLGFSTVSVAKGVVYTLGTDAKFTEEFIIAIDEAKGTELWRAKIGPLFTFNQNTWGDGPRGTPTVDGNLLYALSGAGELVCVDITQKGKEVWRTNFPANLGGAMMTQWGYSESPLVDGNLLLCTPGGPGGTVAALDKMTGKVVWRSKDWTEKATYSSGVVADIQGVRQFVQMGYTGAAGGGSVSGVDVKTGKLLWTKKIVNGDSYAMSPTPIVSGNLVYATTSDGCHLIEIDAKQTATAKYALKNIKKLKNRDGGVVLIDGHVFGHSDPGMWVCQELKSGTAKWSNRDDLQCTSGAIVAADGMLYLVTDDGNVGLIPAATDEMKLVSSFALPERSKIPESRPTSRESKVWAHPVVANGRLYVRDHETIYAYDVRGK